MVPTQEGQDLRALKLSVAVYLGILAMKLGAYWATGVMVLLAEALHTLSDIFVSGFLLIAAIYSRRPADEVHMFGYGRAQNAAALVAATLFISFTSLRLYEEGIPRLFAPAEATYQNLPLAVAVLVVSMVIAAAPLFSLIRQRERGPAAKAQLIELVNDELGLLAALVGTLLAMNGWPMADPFAAVVVATIIAYNGLQLFLENASFLLGRSPGRSFLADVERQARSVDGVLGVHDIRAEYIGPDTVHAGVHIEVQPSLSLREANRIAEEVRRRLHGTTNAGYCVIHVDPAEAESLAAIGSRVITAMP